MSFKIARRIVELIHQNKEVEIREVLDPYSVEQRQCITSIKDKHSSLLFIAVGKKCDSIVAYFLENCRADPNSLGCRYSEKLCCLSMAIDVNSVTIVGILLTHGANPEVVSSYERTPLFHACSYGREKIVRLLIEHGANVNSRNYSGETPLTESVDNLELFEYLISNGANVNSVDDFGQTVLMMACETEEDETIYFLLSCENIDVRLRNDYGEDALHLAVRYCSEDFVKEIIRKGSYTENEIIEVFELESCFSRVRKDVERARELWQKALKLRSLPIDTPMFENQHSTGKLQTVADVINTGDIMALLYLESTQGLNNVFTLNSFVRAVCNVKDEDKYITLCEFFFETLHSLEDILFFKNISQSVALIRHYLYSVFSSNRSNSLKIFGVFVAFIEEIRLRFEQMTPPGRLPYANEVESFIYFIIELVCNIDEKCPEYIHLFQEGIEHIFRSDLPGLHLEYVIQICGFLQSPDSIIECFVRCGADVNSTNKEGKTVLHEVVESEMLYRERIVDKIVKNGFDFSRVTYDEYCLQCRLERENIIPHSVKYVSLQCLAARTLCEKTMNCFSDVPHYLRTIVNSHFSLT